MLISLNFYFFRQWSVLIDVHCQGIMIDKKYTKSSGVGDFLIKSNKCWDGNLDFFIWALNSRLQMIMFWFSHYIMNTHVICFLPSLMHYSDHFQSQKKPQTTWYNLALPDSNKIKHPRCWLWSFFVGAGSNDWMVGGVLSWHH